MMIGYGLVLRAGNADLDIHLPADVFAAVDHGRLAADIEEAVAREHEVFRRDGGCRCQHECGDNAGRAHPNVCCNQGSLPAEMIPFVDRRRVYAKSGGCSLEACPARIAARLRARSRSWGCAGLRPARAIKRAIRSKFRHPGVIGCQLREGDAMVGTILLPSPNMRRCGAGRCPHHREKLAPSKSFVRGKSESRIELSRPPPCNAAPRERKPS